MLHHLRVPAFLLLITLCSAPGRAVAPPIEGQAKVEVLSTRQSALLSVNISSFRKIGNVVIEVRDAQGVTLYKEEGKAMTPELVRRLDKGAFPKGPLKLFVTAKDFAVERPFTIE